MNPDTHRGPAAGLVLVRYQLKERCELHVEPEEKRTSDIRQKIPSPMNAEPKRPAPPQPREPAAGSTVPRNQRTRNGVVSQRGLEPAERMLAPKSPHSVRSRATAPDRRPGSGSASVFHTSYTDRASGLQRGLWPGSSSATADFSCAEAGVPSPRPAREVYLPGQVPAAPSFRFGTLSFCLCRPFPSFLSALPSLRSPGGAAAEDLNTPTVNRRT